MVTTLNNLSTSKCFLENNKKKSIFAAKTYLAYDIKKGFYIEQLNWVQVILRHFFKCYKRNTHLNLVVMELKKIEKDKINNAIIKSFVDCVINKHDQINFSLILNNKEKKFIVKLESQIKHNKKLYSCTQDLNKLGYKYDCAVNLKVFTELYIMFSKIKTKTDNVFYEISLFKEKIENAKKDLKNAKNICELDEKIKDHNHLHVNCDNPKQAIYKIKSELQELSNRIKIKIFQILNEIKHIWKPFQQKKHNFFLLSICNYEYVVKSLFWEKLSFLFYYFDQILELEQNICLCEKDLYLKSYQNAIETRIEQIGESKKAFRKARKEIYEKVCEQKKIEQERFKHEKLEQEKLKQEMLKQEMFKHERLEQKSLEQEQCKQKQLEYEGLKQEMFKHERLEQKSLEQEQCKQKQLEYEGLKQEMFKHERLEQKSLEQEQCKQKQLEHEGLKQEMFKNERLEQKSLEQKSLEQEQFKQKQLEQERLEQERIEDEQRYRKYILDLQEIKEQKKQNKRQLQNELNEIKLEADQQRLAQRLKYEQELKELNDETNRFKKDQKEKLAQELMTISNNSVKIIQDAEKKMQEISLELKILKQEKSEDLDSIIKNTYRIEFYNLVMEKLGNVRILSKRCEVHRKVLTELLQIEKAKHCVIPYDKIMPILKSIDVNNLQEFLVRLEEIKDKMLGDDK